MRLKDKVAIITGGSRGIGYATADKFLKEGATVILTASSQGSADKAVAQLKEKYPDATVAGISPNLSNLESVRNAFREAASKYGCIDILVNNAGITKDGLMMRMSEAQWDAVIAVNLKSAFNFIHACTPIMMRQKSGSIINMASVVGVHGNAGQCNYSASKAGMIGLAKSIAQELGSRGIRANAIAPGFIITDMTAKLSDEVKAEWAKKIPLRRGGTPEDVADVATFLASDMSSYVSGQVIQVDGGMNM